MVLGVRPSPCRWRERGRSRAARSISPSHARRGNSNGKLAAALAGLGKDWGQKTCCCLTNDRWSARNNSTTFHPYLFFPPQRHRRDMFVENRPKNSQPRWRGIFGPPNWLALNGQKESLPVPVQTAVARARVGRQCNYTGPISDGIFGNFK